MWKWKGRMLAGIACSTGTVVPKDGVYQCDGGDRILGIVKEIIW